MMEEIRSFVIEKARQIASWNKMEVCYTAIEICSRDLLSNYSS